MHQKTEEASASSVFLFLPQILADILYFKPSRKNTVHDKRHQNTYTGVKHTVQCIRDVSVHRSIEQDDAQDHAARLYTAYPEHLAQHDEDHGTNKGQRDQQPVVTTLGIEDQIETEQNDADQAADDGTKKAVTSVELGVLQITAHTENSSDAGECRTPVREKGVNQRTDSRCQ